MFTLSSVPTNLNALSISINEMKKTSDVREGNTVDIRGSIGMDGRKNILLHKHLFSFYFGGTGNGRGNIQERL